ncbi:uncharacterized protein CC84DRAFT_1179883 [Paraphaeosphaeria sporulosa]|uniref:CENP-V/GFA domain-containing protein n=1 Tax=Paraphaeosphaeria sporulosa TaxID=1460663 RepID=A0A177BZE4_9PLEO|nr:uncharacterized protein CC84DRAFT_1179883 [Paraphaeosphaeria sporulosa]OAG00753.1 hypothetical protein CC84DRAFT_1179883 [Paraphaeosphaeria sporulosa]
MYHLTFAILAAMHFSIERTPRLTTSSARSQLSSELKPSASHIMSNPVPTSSAHITCLCGQISLPGTSLANPTFPLPSTICHCNPCRYTSGGLLPAFASLKSAPCPEIQAKLGKYQFTPSCVRYFCEKCGCQCFVEHPQAAEEEWFCTTGMVEVSEKDGENAEGVKDVVQLVGHMYIDDLRDGGVISVFLPITGASASEPELYAAKYRTRKLNPMDLDSIALASGQHPPPGPEEQLEARCHCGGVDLRIKRAEYDDEPERVGSLMTKDDPHRYLARFCACRSCRLSMGFSLCPWTYVALSSVINAKTSQPVVFGADAEKEGANEGLRLQHHHSRDDVWRSFCGGCGASVFYYSSDESRSNVVDIAVGILRAKSGSLAREWVRWADGEEGAVVRASTLEDTIGSWHRIDVYNSMILAYVDLFGSGAGNEAQWIRLLIQCLIPRAVYLDWHIPTQPPMISSTNDQEREGRELPNRNSDDLCAFSGCHRFGTNVMSFLHIKSSSAVRTPDGGALSLSLERASSSKSPESTGFTVPSSESQPDDDLSARVPLGRSLANVLNTDLDRIESSTVREVEELDDSTGEEYKPRKWTRVSSRAGGLNILSPTLSSDFNYRTPAMNNCRCRRGPNPYFRLRCEPTPSNNIDTTLGIQQRTEKCAYHIVAENYGSEHFTSGRSSSGLALTANSHALPRPA